MMSESFEKQLNAKHMCIGRNALRGDGEAWRASRLHYKLITSEGGVGPSAGLMKEGQGHFGILCSLGVSLPQSFTPMLTGNPGFGPSMVA